MGSFKSKKRIWKLFYNFRKSRRSVWISRWKGVITFRDRRVDICDVDDEDGWLSTGVDDDWTFSVRLLLLLNNNYRYHLNNHVFMSIFKNRESYFLRVIEIAHLELCEENRQPGFFFLFFHFAFFCIFESI